MIHRRILRNIQMNQRGVVSNVFGNLLKRQIPLRDIIRNARKDLNISYVELRQTALGPPYESQDFFPDTGAIKNLAVEFKDIIKFNLAIQLPYLSGTVNATNETFLQGVSCSKALAEVSGCIPHLRVVDPITSSKEMKEVPKDVVARNIEEMLDKMTEIGGILSLENSGQEGFWQHYWSIIDLVVRHRERLKLCFDPCNLVKSEKTTDGDTIANLTPLTNTQQGPKQVPWKSDDIAIFHIKQTNGEQLLQVVCEGVVHWPKQLAQIQRIGYSGPVCLEIPPSEDIYENLKKSWDYLSKLSKL